MDINIYTDGGSLNNPGEAAIGFVIFKGNKKILSGNKRIGIASNNQAEYEAVIAALEAIKKIISNKTIPPPTRVVFYSDSRLLVNQVNGLFKIKNSKIRDYIFKIRSLENEIGVFIVYKNIPREKNALADSLVKKALGR